MSIKKLSLILLTISLCLQSLLFIATRLMVNYHYDISESEQLYDLIINDATKIEKNILLSNLFYDYINKGDTADYSLKNISEYNTDIYKIKRELDSLFKSEEHTTSKGLNNSYIQLSNDILSFIDTIENGNISIIKLNNERLNFIGSEFNTFYEYVKYEKISKVRLIGANTINTIKYAGFLTFIQFIILLIYLIVIYRSIYKSFHYLLNSTNRVILGDFDFSPPDKIYNNEMGRLIKLYSKMIQTLKDSHDATELRKWLRIGENELYSRITNKNSISIYSNAVLSQICKYVSASCGAYYTYEPNEGLLYLSATYALDDKSTKIKFKLEESIIGESVLKKEVKIIKDIPVDYIKIQSSLGSTPPRNLIIIPVYYDEQLLCAIEIAKYNDITDIELEFLHSAQNIIANSFITNWNNEIKEKWNI